MDRQPYRAQVSPVSAGIKGRCPRCGQGRLFAGYLTAAPGCTACGLDYEFADAGDGPAVFIILIVGFIVVGLALGVEVTYRPPYWVHAVLWLPLGIILPLLLLRPAKGILLCQQYSQQAREGRIDRP
jgi:uncharacterized protein (DUF983 family)